MNKLDSDLPQSILQDFYHRHLGPVFLVILLLVSSFAVIVVTYKVRQANSELQELESERYRLEVTWRKLRLEQSALSEHSRIEQIGVKQLDMKYVNVEEERAVIK